MRSNDRRRSVRAERATTADPLRQARREPPRYKRGTEALVGAVANYLQQLNALMQQPSTSARGSQIAKLSNDLEIAKDRTRFQVLAIDFRTGKKRRGTPAALRSKP